VKMGKDIKFEKIKKLSVLQCVGILPVITECMIDRWWMMSPLK